jgi:hypothetical protein
LTFSSDDARFTSKADIDAVNKIAIGRPSAIWRLREDTWRGSPGWAREMAGLGPATQRLLRPHPRSSYYRAGLSENTMRPRLCSLLGVAIELPELPLSFGAAIRRMGSFVLVALAHSMQSPFCVGCFHFKGLRMEQLRELE